MYVCLCKGITDKAIKQQVAAGVETMRELKACTGVGSHCGQCTCQASQILHNELVLQHQASAELGISVA